jgi:hypothetical protein
MTRPRHRALHSRHRGLSRTDVIALIIAAVALVAIITLFLFRLSPHSSITISMRDGTNLRQIHQGALLFAGESRGLYPRPGLMKRKPITFNDEQRIIPGRGDENTAHNTTDRLYSSLIAQRYASPALMVSPGEVNPNVREMRDFNYDAFAPARHSYWDDRFTADLQHGSHVSYAHLLLHGERKFALWNENAPSNTPLFGTRGPIGGVADPDSYTCDRRGNWSGMIVRNDNTTIQLDRMTPPDLFIISDGQRRPALVPPLTPDAGGSRSRSRESPATLRHRRCRAATGCAGRSWACGTGGSREARSLRSARSKEVRNAFWEWRGRAVGAKNFKVARMSALKSSRSALITVTGPARRASVQSTGSRESGRCCSPRIRRPASRSEKRSRGKAAASTSTRRSTRSGNCEKNCIAMPPPSECPTTVALRTSSAASRSRIAAAWAPSE